MERILMYLSMAFDNEDNNSNGYTHDEWLYHAMVILIVCESCKSTNLFI